MFYPGASVKTGVPFVDVHAQAPRKLVLLLVDDEPDIRTAVARFVSGAIPDVEVVSAPGGAEALEILRTRHVDVILTDFRMPGMDGLAFLERAKDLAREAPRIMLTAFPDLELATRALNEEAVMKFLTKPIDPQKLMAALREACDLVLTRDARRLAIERQLGHAP